MKVELMIFYVMKEKVSTTYISLIRNYYMFYALKQNYLFTSLWPMGITEGHYRRWKFVRSFWRNPMDHWRKSITNFYRPNKYIFVSNTLVNFIISDGLKYTFVFSFYFFGTATLLKTKGTSKKLARKKKTTTKQNQRENKPHLRDHNALTKQPLEAHHKDTREWIVSVRFPCLPTKRSRSAAEGGPATLPRAPKSLYVLFAPRNFIPRPKAARLGRAHQTRLVFWAGFGRPHLSLPFNIQSLHVLFPKIPTHNTHLYLFYQIFVPPKILLFIFFSKIS